jgi:hypothetical protein
MKTNKLVETGQCFVDLGRWLEPERADGKPRAYEPYQVVKLKSKGTLRSLAELLQAEFGHKLPCAHTSDK